MTEIIQAGRTGTRYELPAETAERLSPATSKIGRLQRWCTALLHEHQDNGELPTSGRFLFYELVARELVDKTATRGSGRSGRGVDQDIADALLDLRERGIVPWDWLVDETRNVTALPTAASIADWLRDAVDRSRIDPWDGRSPVVITESRSLKGALQPVAYQYAVPVCSTNGQAGGFLVTDVVPFLAYAGRTVLYLGDWDFSGGHIEANTQNYLAKHAAGYGDIQWVRVAVTEQQVRDHDLVIVQKYDARTRSHHDAVETEALGQATIVAVLRDALDELLDEPLADVQVREREQRASLADWLHAYTEDDS